MHVLAAASPAAPPPPMHIQVRDVVELIRRADKRAAVVDAHADGVRERDDRHRQQLAALGGLGRAAEAGGKAQARGEGGQTRNPSRGGASVKQSGGGSTGREDV
eukprot:360138-Chlamydomonas_euryale.AAC.2